ncbi:hypothetical protein ACWIG4_18215 [Streptomyces sp. NPDC002248]
MGAVADATEQELDQLSAYDTAPGQAALALALAQSVDLTPAPTARANAARELRTVLAELRKLAPAGEEGDALDDLAQRREARRARGA